MASQTAYSCSQCNYHTVKWLGCCPSCNEWDTLAAATHSAPPIRGTRQRASGRAIPARMVRITEIEQKEEPRLITGINEWDRVTGGGLVPGSLSILTGDPGIGKSTLLLHVCQKIAQSNRVFYFSTEESLTQIRQRAARIGCIPDNLFLSSEAELGAIVACAQEEKPTLLLIDSIQSCFVSGASSTPGSISQLREATFQLMRLAKEHNITTIITGHITKEGIIAGPKMLEHMVDAVFYLQGEDRWHSRALRAVKNRFGAVNELGFFEMKQDGLKELPNINAQLLSDVSHSPGSALISVMEGSRPLMLELQALTIESKLAMPQRVISGVDHKQVILIAAILQKYLQVKLNTHDIFFKVGGGFAIKNSAADLGIALALLSSYFQQPLPVQSVALGEISLTGQVKPINQVELFINEAQTFGIKHLMISANQKIPQPPCTVQRFQNVYQLLTLFDE